MVRRARRQWGHRAGARFVVGTTSPRVADYAIASGIFNVRLRQPPDRWTAFIARTLADMAATSRRGFAANFMAPRDRAEDEETALYRSAPAPWIDYCERDSWRLRRTRRRVRLAGIHASGAQLSGSDKTRARACSCRSRGS